MSGGDSGASAAARSSAPIRTNSSPIVGRIAPGDQPSYSVRLLGSPRTGLGSAPGSESLHPRPATRGMGICGQIEGNHDVQGQASLLIGVAPPRVRPRLWRRPNRSQSGPRIGEKAIPESGRTSGALIAVNCPLVDAGSTPGLPRMGGRERDLKNSARIALMFSDMGMMHPSGVKDSPLVRPRSWGGNHAMWIAGHLTVVRAADGQQRLFIPSNELPVF